MLDIDCRVGVGGSDKRSKQLRDFFAANQNTERVTWSGFWSQYWF